MSFFQPLKIQPESVPIPFKYLDPVTVSVAEYEQGVAERVEFETAFHDDGQTIYTFSHIGVSTRQIHALTRKFQHLRLNSIHKVASLSAGYALSATMRTLPTCI